MPEYIVPVQISIDAEVKITTDTPTQACRIAQKMSPGEFDWLAASTDVLTPVPTAEICSRDQKGADIP